MILLYTEDSPHMREVIIDETLADMDKDKDGFVTLEEYISECVCVSEGEWVYEREGGRECVCMCEWGGVSMWICVCACVHARDGGRERELDLKRP